MLPFHKNYKLDSETQSPARSLKYAYLLAFAIIALFSMGMHASTNLLMSQLTISSDVTYHLSTVRTMLQRLPNQVSNLKEHSSDIDQALLTNSLQKIENSVNFITKKVWGEDTVSEELREVFFGDSFALHKHIQTYIQAAGVCATKDMSHNNASQICRAAESRMNDLNGQKLIAGFDIALHKYRTETLDKIDFHHQMQAGGIVVILLVLILEAFLIFRPLIVRIDKYHGILLEQAFQDPLTNLKNRRAFISHSKAELSQAIRDKKSIAMALMDLDKFKSVNDTYGHDVGDAVIKHFADQLKMRVRRGDIIGRIGGEEFAVLLVRSTSDEDAFAVINRLREAVAQIPCPYVDKNGNQQELPYTVSIGLYSLVPTDESVQDMLTRADEMLYRAKENGRNKVVLINKDGKQLES